MSFDPWFEPYQTTSSGSPQLQSEEFEIRHLTNDVHIYHGDKKVRRSGKLIITTHRILWEGKKKEKLALQLRYVNGVELVTGAFMGMFSSAKIKLHLKSRVWQPDPNVPGKPLRVPNPGYILYSFHDGGADESLNVLQNALKQEAWKKTTTIAPVKKAAAPTVGIRGIIRQQREQQAFEKKAVSAAFGDLESLMEQARLMVQIANKLKNTTDATENADVFDNLLGNLGVVSAVTKEAAGSQYHQLLARQLSDFISVPIEQSGGMMTLVDAYCLYNRARGTDLVSPDDFRQACKQTKKMNGPVVLCKLPTGGLVLQSRASQNVGNAIMELLEKMEYLDERIVSQHLNLSIKIANNNLRQCEQNGLVCRDKAPAALRFYKNFFMDYETSILIT